MSVSLFKRLTTTAQQTGYAVVLFSCLSLVGCATYEEQPLPRDREPIAAPAPSTQVVVYPSGGQSAEQLDRDRYECHGWAVKQSAFDPSEKSLAPHQRVEVVSAAPQGSAVAAGAVTGAVLGAAVSQPRNAGGGAIFGAVAGAIVGAAASESQQEKTNAVQRRYDERDAYANARLDQQADSYRRAIGACLEGRGYTVK